MHDTTILDAAIFFRLSDAGRGRPAGGRAGTESRVLGERLLLIPHEAGLRGLRPPQPPPARARCLLQWLSRNSSELKANGQKLIPGLQILVVAKPLWRLTLEELRKFEA